MARTTIDFGIDLGTTNSSVAVIDGVDAKVIPNKMGSVTTPSAVWIDGRGQVHVGHEARMRHGGDSQNAAIEFKRRMGDGEKAKKTFARSGVEMLPEQLSAEVLKSLKMDVRSSMGEDIRAAVITVPAAFENAQTNATRSAAELAGFVSSPLLLEPVAASLAYGFQSQSENVYWLVYDFGGGTFDAAIMRIRDGLIQVVDHAGDNYLGGSKIDQAIIEKKFVPALAEQLGEPGFDPRAPRWADAMAKLKTLAEDSKIEVCRNRAPVSAYKEQIGDAAAGLLVDFECTLTPEDVAAISQPCVQQSIRLCQKTLERQGLRGADLEHILMVGGSTLSPWVREAVEKEIGARLEFGVDPVTVVARGAAIFAGIQEAPEFDEEIAPDAWRLNIEHVPVGNAPDPDIGGRIQPRDGRSLEGFTIEFVDTKSEWRSGRVPLTPDGAFMAQLHAERQRRHEYAIELCDPTGTRLPTSPTSVTYVLGVPPDERPPAPMTIGVGLANGSVAPYIKKGDKLPIRKTKDHVLSEQIRAGNTEDKLRIPLLEGEHPRAERNHMFGVLEVTGEEFDRDLSVGSEVEVTLIQDESMIVRVQIYVPRLEFEREVPFSPQRVHSSVAELRKEADGHRERLELARKNAAQANAEKAEGAMTQIAEQDMEERLDAVVRAAEADETNAVEADRFVRRFAAAVDEVEDAINWPLLLDEAEKARKGSEELMERHGEKADKARFDSIVGTLERAKAAGDPEAVRSCISDLQGLLLVVLDRQQGFHVAHFEHLTGQVDEMRDRAQADQIIARGRKAIANDDVQALKAANHQLMALLPSGQQEAARNVAWGTTMTASG